MPTQIKVYCDRLATVTIHKDRTAHTDAPPMFLCPKCGGNCSFNSKLAVPMWDCRLCGRGWERVPDSIQTAREAEQWLIDQELAKEKPTQPGGA
jgi:ribosomal protein L37AE/L43A